MGATRRSKIRQLFLRPNASYSLATAATLLGLHPCDLQRWIDSGEVECDGSRLPWEEVVSFAMEWWSQDVVEEALGKDVARVIPDLLRLAELHVRIPAMEIMALERVADREGTSTSAVLARELLDFVSTHADWLRKDVRGFNLAFAWPSAAVDAQPARN